MRNGTTLLLLALAAGVGCGDSRRPGDRHRPLVVFAAASVGDAIRQAADAFERQHGLRVDISSAASGILRRQIELDAPCDVFVSADIEHMDRLASLGRIDPETRRDVAANVLVIVSGDRDADPWDGPDRLRDADAGRVAIANPDYVPAGRYAREALTHHGLWTHVAARAVFGDNVRLVLRQITIGGLKHGIVYKSDAASTETCTIVYEFQPAAHTPIRYPAAAVARPGPPHPLAADFCEFLASDEVGLMLRSHGFTTPPSGDRAVSGDGAPAAAG